MATVTQSFAVTALGASKANVVQSASLPSLPAPDSASLSLKNVESHRQEISEKRLLKAQNHNEKDRLKAFQKAQQEGLTYACASCRRWWFRTSVTKIKDKQQASIMKILDSFVPARCKLDF